MRSKLLLSAVAALAVTSASAADLAKGKKAPPAPVVVSPWDWTVGGGLTTNYIFRGITQSDNRPSVNANAEIRYNFNDTFTGYVGTAGSSVKLTSGNAFASPSLEWDAMGGLRGTFGAFGIDVGAVGYIYPSFTTSSATGAPFPTNTTWWEGYVKTTYAINDMITVGVNGFATPSYVHTGASAQYIAGTLAVKLPMDLAFSGELGRQFIGTGDTTHGKTAYPDYTYWNAGLAYSYKIATLDLRYHDSNLSKAQCKTLTADSTPKYCNAAYVATLSFALSAKDVK